MDLYTKLQDMAHLQNLHNQRINDDWRRSGFNYRRAVWVECAELMDHLGWKWWTIQNTDKNQVLLEIVDIWHFGLSMMIIEEQITQKVAMEIEAFFNQPPEVTDQHQVIEEFVLAMLEEERFAREKFFTICVAMQINFDMLHQHYLAKHVLNEFRQDNGYSTGKYIKVWQGREDNQHLIEIVAQAPTLDSTFKHRIYEALQNKYDANLSEQ